MKVRSKAYFALHLFLECLDQPGGTHQAWSPAPVNHVRAPTSSDDVRVPILTARSGARLSRLEVTQLPDWAAKVFNIHDLRGYRLCQYDTIY